MRVPGYANLKYHDRPISTIIEMNPDRRFNLSDFHDYFDTPASDQTGTSAPFTVGETIRDGEHSVTLFRIGRSLKAKGLSAPGDQGSAGGREPGQLHAAPWTLPRSRRSCDPF